MSTNEDTSIGVGSLVEGTSVLELPSAAPPWLDCETFGRAAVENGWLDHTDWFVAALDYQFCVIHGIPLYEFSGHDSLPVHDVEASPSPLPAQKTLEDPAPTAPAKPAALPESTAPKPEVAETPATSLETPVSTPAATAPATAATRPAAGPPKDQAASLDAPAAKSEPLATPEQRAELLAEIRHFINADDALTRHRSPKCVRLRLLRRSHLLSINISCGERKHVGKADACAMSF